MELWTSSAGINRDTYKLYSLPSMRRDVLYPCGFQKWDTKPGLASLVTLAARKVTADSKCTFAAVQCCPANLCTNLLQEALLRGNDRSINVLVSNWPSRSLVLRQVLPNVNNYTRARYDDEFCMNVGARQTQAIMYVVTSFVNHIKEGRLKNLCILDISGFISGVIVQEFIVTQTEVLNANKDLQMRVKNGKTGNTLHDEYLICMPLMVDADNFPICYKILKGQKSDSVMLKIQIEMLNLNPGLSPRRTWKLLSCISLERIEGLTVAYVPDAAETDCQLVMEKVKKMTSLHSLSVFITNETYKHFIEEDISTLQKLQHLHLALKLRGNLKKTLDSLSSLSVIEIENIQTTTELKCLSEWQGLYNLQELHITGRFPSGHLLLQVLEKTVNLKGLHLFDKEHFNQINMEMQPKHLIRVLSRLDQLKYLYICGSFLKIDRDNNSDCLASHEMDPVTCLPQLEYLHVDRVYWTGWSDADFFDSCATTLRRRCQAHVSEMRMKKNLPPCLVEVGMIG